MRNLLKSLAIGVATLGVAGAAAAHEHGKVDKTGWPTSFTIGTASQGGTYFGYGSGWAAMIGEKYGITAGGEVTGGPMQNMALVHTGDVEFGLTTTGPAAESIAGNSPLAPGVKMDNVRAIFPMYQTPFSVTVLANSPVTAVSAIPDGSRIGFGPAASTSDTYFPRMMETLGVDFDRRNGGWSDLAGQMQDGLIDVIAFAAGIPVSAVSQLEAQTDIRVIGFSEEELAKITEAFPVARFTIPSTTYTSIDADQNSVAMWNFAIAQADMPESFIYEVVKATMTNHDKMMQIHKASRATLPENYIHNTVIPWHPGAVRWFEENGFEIDDDLEG